MNNEGRPFLRPRSRTLTSSTGWHAMRARTTTEPKTCVQETYLRAYAAFGNHRGPSTKAWLVTICVNLVRSEGRRQAGTRVVETALPPSYEPEAAGVSVPEAALASLDRGSISRALARIPDDQRLAIVLMDLAGHSASEVAEMLGCPRNTVLSRAHRGRQRLASLLVEEDVNRDVP